MTSANWAKSIIFLIILMISGLVLVVIIEGLTSGTGLTPLNLAIEELVKQMRTPFLTNFFVFVTHIGNPFVLSSATILISAFLAMRGRFYDALAFASVMAVAVVSLLVLKNTFQITRPDSDLVEVGGWSFPSGHATIATAFFFALTHTFLRRMKTLERKTLLVVVSVLGAFLICLSRLYLGAHWAIDVLAGVALGLLSATFTILLFSVFLDGHRSLRDRIDA